MSFEKSTFQHEFACRPAGLKSDKKFTTEITLYSLVLSVDNQKKEDIILTRPANDVIMKAKNIAKPKKFAKTQKGCIPHEWRAYEHLGSTLAEFPHCHIWPLLYCFEKSTVLHFQYLTG